MSGFIFIPTKPDKIKNAFEKGLFAAREQILTDCNYFVRQDQGALKASGRTELGHFLFGSDSALRVIYNTPYAKRVYYTGGRVSTDVNPNASLQWCQKAADRFGNDWQKIIEKGMNNSL